MNCALSTACVPHASDVLEDAPCDPSTTSWSGGSRTRRGSKEVVSHSLENARNAVLRMPAMDEVAPEGRGGAAPRRGHFPLRAQVSKGRAVEQDTYYDGIATTAAD